MNSREASERILEALPFLREPFWRDARIKLEAILNDLEYDAYRLGWDDARALEAEGRDAGDVGNQPSRPTFYYP